MKFRYIIFVNLLFFSAFTLAKPFKIAELEFKGSRVIDVIRVLAEDAEVNIIATPEAGEKEITIFLKDIDLEQAIKAICRISNLWYRRTSGKKAMFHLMTTQEYAKNLVVGQDDDIRVFQLHNPNVTAIASAIEDLYADRVEVSFGESSQTGSNNQGGSNRSGGGSSRNNRNRGGRSSGSRSGGRSGGNTQRDKLADELTVNQFESLTVGGTQVSAKRLENISGVNKVIYVTVNTEHNLLIVKTSNQSVLKSIANLVKSLDKPQTQVMLEMKIIDIKVGEDFSSLFKLELQGGRATGDSLNPITIGGAAFTGGGTLMYEYLSKSIKANIELMEKNNRVTVVSNPMLVASNHRPASLFVGEERVMVRGYSIDTIDTLNNTRSITTPETEIEEIGTTLEITPHINSDGTIHIILKQENSTLVKAAALIPISDGLGSVLNLPVDSITTAKLEGEIFAKHGYTVAVGGLIRDSFSRNRTKVPLLADIPLLGHFFRSTIDNDNRSEMVLLITPYILNQTENNKTFDAMNKYHKYAPGKALQSLPLPKKQPQISLKCGQYCSPRNLTKTDL